jgi:hypothetical protein
MAITFILKHFGKMINIHYLVHLVSHAGGNNLYG